MRSMVKWLLTAAALTTVAAAAGPAAAQPYGYGDDGPPPFRRGPGWAGPPRGSWDRWHHHRHWRDEGFDHRGWRDGDRREGRDRFGSDGGERRFGNEDARRERGDGDALRRGGPGRGGPDRIDRRSFGNDAD